MSEEFSNQTFGNGAGLSEPYPCLVRPLTGAHNWVRRIGGRCAAPFCINQLRSADWAHGMGIKTREDGARG